ncbi:carbohydrate porin [Nostoc calcicola FACHB-3891]|nr:carbohydrate porin [Nostoc calcicola FACHB-3891]
MTREDLLTLQQLREEVAIELATLQGRVDNLEANMAKLEANQFSTTTKLTRLVVTAITGGGFSGDRIIHPKGAEIANENPHKDSNGINIKCYFHKKNHFLYKNM